MKFLSGLTVMLLLSIAGLALAPASLDTNGLRGGAAVMFDGGGEDDDDDDGGGGGDPPLTKYRCDPFCGNDAACPAVAACARNATTGVCTAISREFSGKCVADANGPLNNCLTLAANEYCVKTYANPCTAENPVCTHVTSGCGVKYKCT
jgi:hypothetical protein